MKWIKAYENFEVLKGYSDQYTSYEYLKLRSIIEEMEKLSKIGSEISKDDIDFIDRVSGYTMLYSSIKYFVKDVFDIFKKYDMVDIKDRLLEFFDKVPKFNPYVMFSISSDKSSLGISENKLDDRSYFLSIVSSVLRDILYNCSVKHGNITVDEYFSTHRPSIYIDLNLSWTENVGRRPTYNLVFLEKLADDIVKRFRYLYDIEDVDYELDRENRRYNTNIDIESYSIKLYLK